MDVGCYIRRKVGWHVLSKAAWTERHFDALKSWCTVRERNITGKKKTDTHSKLLNLSLDTHTKLVWSSGAYSVYVCISTLWEFSVTVLVSTQTWLRLLNMTLEGLSLNFLYFIFLPVWHTLAMGFTTLAKTGWISMKQALHKIIWIDDQKFKLIFFSLLKIGPLNSDPAYGIVFFSLLSSNGMSLKHSAALHKDCIRSKKKCSWNMFLFLGIDAVCDNVEKEDCSSLLHHYVGTVKYCSLHLLITNKR